AIATTRTAVFTLEPRGTSPGESPGRDKGGLEWACVAVLAGLPVCAFPAGPLATAASPCASTTLFASASPRPVALRKRLIAAILSPRRSASTTSAGRLRVGMERNASAPVAAGPAKVPPWGPAV